MTRKILVLSLLAAGAIGGALVLDPPAVEAQPGYGRGMGGGMGAGPGAGMGRADAPWRQRFAVIDADGDGRISRAEMQAQAEGVFAAMDVDSSGRLTMKEYMAVRMGAQNGGNPARMEAMQRAKADRFAPMDKDGDGLVDEAEFRAGHMAMFDAADDNRDGFLTPAEFRGRHW